MQGRAFRAATIGAVVVAAALGVGFATAHGETDPGSPDEASAATAEANGPEATGLIWPEDTVFLKRGDDLTGSFTVVNPTQTDITVAKPTFEDSTCVQEPLDDAPTVDAPAGLPTTIEISVPTSCDQLRTGDLTLTASATAGDKYDVAAIKVEAEVDWADFGTWLLVMGVSALIVALVTALVAGAKYKVHLSGPLLVDGTAPASALTSITAIGSLVSALVAAPGLLGGLTGSDTSPQLTLTVTGAAIAAVLIGVATVIGNIPISHGEVDDKDQVCVTIWQFVVAAAFTATGAAVVLWTFATAASRLDLPISSDVTDVCAAVGMAIVAAYVIFTVYRYIALYAPKPAGPTPVPKATADVVAAIAAPLAVKYLPQGRPSRAELGNWISNAKVAANAIVVDQPTSAAAEPVASAAGRIARNLI
jgi:hypothetical protein